MKKFRENGKWGNAAGRRNRSWEVSCFCGKKKLLHIVSKQFVQKLQKVPLFFLLGSILGHRTYFKSLISAYAQGFMTTNLRRYM